MFLLVLNPNSSNLMINKLNAPMKDNFFGGIGSFINFFCFIVSH